MSEPTKETKVCGACGGSGTQPGTIYSCLNCGGTGRVEGKKETDG